MLLICKRRNLFLTEFGKIFRQFRESKGMSLREVARTDLSASQISRFERGLSSLSVESFYACLNNLNVSLGEFELRYRNYIQDDNIVFNSQISEAYLEGNIPKLLHILDKLVIQDTKISYLNSIVVKTAISMCDPSRKVSQKDIKILSDYLFSIEEWGNYELWLFGNTSFILSPQTLNLLGGEMINRTHFYSSSEENKRKVCMMTLNIISTFLEFDELTYSLKFLNYLDRITILETDTYIKMFHKYVKLVYSYKIGDTEALYELNKLVSALEVLECYGSAQKIKDEISKL